MKFAISLLLIGLALIGGVLARGQVVDGIAVIVNEAIITHEDVQNDVASAFELLERQYANQPAILTQKKREVLEKSIEELVERKLILHEFKIAGYNLPESIIEEMIKERVKRDFGDRVKLTMTLQARGITYESYRQQIRERFIVDAMRRRNIASEILISPFKIQTYYQNNLEQYKLGDEVKLRMIYLDKAKHDANLGKIAKEIVAKLNEGVSFAEMAAVYSDGSQSSEGGDWGWVERKVLRPELAGIAFALKTGQRSDVIEQAEGFYIMLVEEARPA